MLSVTFSNHFAEGKVAVTMKILFSMQKKFNYKKSRFRKK